MKFEPDSDEMLVKDEDGRQPLQDLVPVLKTENLKVEVKDEIDVYEEAIEYRTTSQSAAASDAQSSNNQEFSFSVIETKSGEEPPGTKVEFYSEENDVVKSDCTPSNTGTAETHLSARVLACNLCNMVSEDCKCLQRFEAVYLSVDYEDDTEDFRESPSPQCSDKYMCDHCGISYVVKSDLIHHISMHEQKQTICENMSERSLTRINNLILHKTHSLVHTFSCDVCSKLFNRKGNLIRHIRNHSGERPFSCDVCSKSFSRKNHLVLHIRTHSGERSFSCELCRKSFNTESYLNTHRRTHSEERPFSCNLCSKSFKLKSHLTSHRRFHSWERPFSCKLCTKSFSWRSNLRDHTRSHSGESPFSCDVCSKSFSRKPRLVRHTRTYSGACLSSC